jgi:hypothetical protein
MGSPPAPASTYRLNMPPRDRAARQPVTARAATACPQCPASSRDRNRQAAYKGAGPRQGDLHANYDAELPIDTASDLLSGCG